MLLGKRSLGDHLDRFIRRALSPKRAALIEINGNRFELLPWLYEYSPEFLAGAYEAGTTRVIKTLLRPGMRVIDCGAHVGWHTVLVAKAVGGAGRVYAFEPNSESYRALLRNLALNGYTNVLAIQKAVGDSSGQSTLYASKRRTGTDSLYDTGVGRGTLVQTTTLDDFLETQGWPYIDLIKMDIEGAEPAALRGAKQFLQRQDRVNLILEFSPVNLRAAHVNPTQFLTALASLGFQLQAIQDRGDPTPLEAAGPLVGVDADSYINLLCVR